MPSKIVLAAVLVSAIVLTGCAGTPSPLLPASENATMIYNLTVIVFLIAAAVFIVVEGVLFFSVIRFSRHRGAGEPEQIEGNTKFEIAWTAAPAIVLLIVFFVSLQSLFPLANSPMTRTTKTLGGVASAPSLPQGDTVHVRIVGHQWWWEFEYPDYKVVTANELHIPVGKVVTVDVESADVIHSFWVPQLGGKIDVIPGRTNHTWFQVGQPGSFHGQCAEFCGIQHANMRLEVIAETSDQFQAWLQQQLAPVAATTTETAKGEQALMSGACIGCHTIEGTKAQGKVGPNLTHFATRRTFAGASQENNRENLARWLADPPALKPGTLMPNLHLAPDQIDALVTFLESLK
jgi:cytochrome c oxidase subunit 2